MNNEDLMNSLATFMLHVSVRGFKKVKMAARSMKTSYC